MQIEHWVFLAIALGIAEIFSGGFWMLVLAGAALAGGVASWAGLGFAAQAVAAALFAVAGALALQRLRPKRSGATQRDRSVHLDIGERVDVPAWGPDGTARVRYRGALWTAELARPAGADVRAGTVPAPTAAPRPGLHRIVALDANRIVVEPLPFPPVPESPT